MEGLIDSGIASDAFDVETGLVNKKEPYASSSTAVCIIELPSE